mgnify:CR=1 FL=1
MEERVGLSVIQQEWKMTDKRAGRLRVERDDALAQRDEAREWCRAMLVIILVLAMALGYVLANVPV